MTADPIALRPHLVVTSATVLADVEAARPATGPLILAMDDAWTPSWRTPGESVSVLRGPHGTTVIVWERREPVPAPDGDDDGMPAWAVAS